MTASTCGTEHKNESNNARVDNSRQQRAQVIAERGGAVRSGDSWLVPSASTDRVYRVWLDGDQLQCNCEDFKRRRQPCKHQMAVALVHATQQQTANP